LIATFVTEKVIPSGGQIQIKVPSQASVVDGNVLCAVKGMVDKSGMTCVGNAIAGTLTMTTSFVLPLFASSEVHFEMAFNAPRSTEQTDSFVLSFLGTSGELLE